MHNPYTLVSSLNLVFAREDDENMLLDWDGISEATLLNKNAFYYEHISITAMGIGQVNSWSLHHVYLLEVGE